MKSILLAFVALFILIGSVTTPLANAQALQKVRVKIEGVHRPSLTYSLYSWWFKPDKAPPIKRIQSALSSLLGVKSVEVQAKKKWFFSGDYKEVTATIEFQQGTLTSETIIIAIEGASDKEQTFKVKFLE